MDQSHTINSILKQAKPIRDKSRTSCVQIENYLQYQQQKLLNKGPGIWGCGLCSSAKTEIKKQFRQAFKTLSKIEQAELYLMNVKHVNRLLKTLEKNSIDQTQDVELVGSSQEETFNMRFSILNEKTNKKLMLVNAVIISKLKIMRIQETKEQLNLHYFLLRKSKSKDKNILVLQPTQPAIVMETVRISLNSIDFEDSYNIIYALWSQAQYQNIKQLMMQQDRFTRRKGKGKSLLSKISPDNGFQLLASSNTSSQKDSLNPNFGNNSVGSQRRHSKSNLDRSLNMANGVVSTDLIQSLNSFQNFDEQRLGLFYSKQGNKIRKVIEFKNSNADLQTIKSTISDIKNIKRRKNTIVDIKLLNSIPSQRTNIYRQIDLVEGQEYEFIYFRHEFSREGVIYLFEKSVDLHDFKNKSNGHVIKSVINYCLWRIKKVGNKLELMVEADISYNTKVKDPHKISSLYLGQFTNLSFNSNKDVSERKISFDSDQFQNQCLSEINSQQNFFTLNDSINRTEFNQNIQNGSTQLSSNASSSKGTLLKNEESKIGLGNLEGQVLCQSIKFVKT